MKSFIIAATVALVSATVIAAPASAAGKRHHGGGGFNPAMMAAMAPVAIAAGTALVESGALDNIGSPVVSTPVIVPGVSSGLPISVPGLSLPSRLRTDIGG